MTIKEAATKEMAERSKRDYFVRAVLQVISQDPNFASAKVGLDFLLGEIRDLELERNKFEMDAAYWKEKADGYKGELETLGELKAED